jgi:SAM-dependent methyltransferase
MQEYIIAIIGGVFTLIAALIPIYINREKKKKSLKRIEMDSKYAVFKITDIVKDELRKVELNIDGLSFKSNFNISDLRTYTKKIYYPNYPPQKIDNYINQAREIAYTLKYAKPHEDEKLTPIDKIKLPDILTWETYFINIFKQNEVTDYYNYRILDLGIGNGHATENLYRNCKKLTGIDISRKALEYAKEKFPLAHLVQNEAENLCDIHNSSVDLFLAFRVFQSSLFDKRLALIEAFRVLTSGGLIIISIPIMFLRNDGNALIGLIPPDKTEPSMEYAMSVAESIKDLMDTLNFKNLSISKESPFELYIIGKR